MKTIILSCLVAVFLLSAGNATSQINPKKILEKKANKVIEKKTDQAIDSIFDKKAEPKNNNENKNTTEPTKADTIVKPAVTDQPSLQTYSKYDFIPGDKVLLFEDFSQDAVGDFPALWTTDVAGEVNTLNISSGNWFNLKSTEGTYWLMQDIDIPKNFILEMDIIPKKAGGRYAADIVLFGESSHS